MNPGLRILQRELETLEEALENTRHGTPEEDELFAEIKTIKRQIKKLQDCPVLDDQIQRRKQLLFEQLLRCNFKHQIRLVKQVIDKYRTAAFLIHGFPDYGQRVLAYRLTQLKWEWGTGQHIVIEAGSRGTGKSSRRLWVQVAKKLQLDPGTEREKIAAKVGKWLETQDVIFTMHSVDYIPPSTLSSWLKEFWTPLVSIAGKVRCQRRPQTHLLLFLVDYGGHVCDCSDIVWLKQFQEPYEAFMPLLLPKIDLFSKYDLESLIDDITELLPCELSMETLIIETENGTPDLVYERICEYCGFSWEGEIVR